MYRNVSSLIKACDELNLPIWELMIRSEMKYARATRQEVWDKMKNQLQVMENAAHRGADGNGVHSPTGLTGGEAGELILSAIQNSLATNEVNAAMGLICATPTAGSSGTIPGVLFSIDQKLHLTEDQKIQFLFTASAFGLVTANNAMIAGAVGGCQAEVGSASACMCRYGSCRTDEQDSCRRSNRRNETNRRKHAGTAARNRTRRFGDYQNRVKNENQNFWRRYGLKATRV